MKALYIYSKHVKKDRELLKRVEEEMGANVNFIEIDELTIDLKHLVNTTPALIIAPDRLQGELLLNESVDAEILAISELLKEIEADEKKLYNQETLRLDSFINMEKVASEENLLMEMIIEGRI